MRPTQSLSLLLSFSLFTTQSPTELIKYDEFHLGLMRIWFEAQGKTQTERDFFCFGFHLTNTIYSRIELPTNISK